MLINNPYSYSPAPPYKPYRNAQFKKKLDKAIALLNSVNETSLTKEDKRKLKDQISELFSSKL